MGEADAILAPTRADGQFEWHRRRRRWRMIFNELDRRLNEEHLIGVTEFDVLITLNTADGRPCRMSDIAEAVTLSPGGVTRLVERLESRGLVQRIRDPSDARRVHASLTADGSERLAQASATHDAVVDYLSRQQ
jgi:DNA-binding MarR family transcriptional regulator